MFSRVIFTRMGNYAYAYAASMVLDFDTCSRIVTSR